MKLRAASYTLLEQSIRHHRAVFGAIADRDGLRASRPADERSWRAWSASAVERCRTSAGPGTR
ncbi:hypothetical protein ACPZ19_42240 [Amycolatopsis lurida]